MTHRIEMDRRTRAMLADAPPQNWDEGRRRLAVVRSYLESNDRSASAAEAHAAQIGIGRSLFYRLARIYSEHVPRSIERHADGDDASDAERITATAIEHAGAGASQSQIFRTVMELCKEKGMSQPSQRLVRICYSKLLAGQSIGVRMGLNARFALDRAMLDMTIKDEGRSEQAQIVCLVDLEQGIILKHLLSVGDPTSGQAASLLDHSAVRAGRVAVSESDPMLFVGAVRSAIAGANGILIAGRWRTGTAIRAAIGLKIGRVSLLSRASDADDIVKAVEFQTASDVIDELMTDHGSSDR